MKLVSKHNSCVTQLNMVIFTQGVIFLNQVNSKNFRELIRILERKLGLLNKEDTCCPEVTLAQCHALVEIGRSEAISLKELANLLGLDVSTMSRTVESLVKKDFVFRSPSKVDRRSIDIQLTDKGLNIFNEIETKMDDEFKNIFEEISIDDQSTVLSGLNIIIEAFNKRQNTCSDNDQTLKSSNSNK